MGKATGFLEYERKLPEDRLPIERLGDWNEFHQRFDNEDEQRAQGARCMDCGIPFCHSGILYKGMAMGCPLHNLIPEWNDLIYRGLWKEASKRLQMTNSFPEFTGRVCPAPCEGSCTAGHVKTAVTIRNNEWSIIERAFDEGWVQPNPPKFRSGKKVAVVGSGPSGLACADALNKFGHLVTVFERADRPGGLLMYGIPNMKLDKRIVKRRVDLMMDEGVNFALNTEVGKDYPTEKLREEYDAVVLCGGATKPRDLKVEGRELNGVYFAVDFLRANTKSLLDSGLSDGMNISAKNKNVIVIGGGDTGTDCVATALRHGCKNVVQFEIVPQPPVTRFPDNPWPEWPKVKKTDYGQEEAEFVFGSDQREYCINTKKIASDGKGNVKALETVRVEWYKDDSGRLTFKEIAGSEKMYEADLVLLAMGFLGPDESALDQLGVERDARSNAKADAKNFQTNLSGVFAAGDMRRGQSLVVWAISEGRAAAKACSDFLLG